MFLPICPPLMLLVSSGISEMAIHWPQIQDCLSHTNIILPEPLMHVLIAFNVAGCTDTLCLPVTTIVVPGLDVPNAFTPNSGDVNSVIFVRGYGIARLRFTIWNRWGQKVFETADYRIGWDGTFQGKLQPMDVYAYTLEAEFFDGTRTTKKGDITLIR
jgi:gliding motility-associated-like protein